MKALAFVLALTAALLPGSTLAAGAMAPAVTTPVLVSISAIPSGTTHGVLTFSGVSGRVTSAIVRFGPAGWTAKPLNAASAKGFTLDFKPKIAGSRSATVCFIATARLRHVAFVRGTWSFGRSTLVKPIDPKAVHVGDCRE